MVLLAEVIKGGLSRSSTLKTLILRRGLQCSVGKTARLRSEGWWISEHRPGLYPETPEDRHASALKYGLRPEDYVSSPADYVYKGDYPELGDINYGVKDPYENWSFPSKAFNYNEPIRYDYWIYYPDRYTPTHLEEDLWKVVWQIFLYYGVLVTAIYCMITYGPIHHGSRVAKQYPYDFDHCGLYENPTRYPLTHYGFEPADAPDDDGYEDWLKTVKSRKN